MTDEQLSALLRVKRFEQPAPQYFDRLLQDLHRRQRAELLHRPLWKIAAERVQTFFSEHSMGHLSYAGALALVLIVGVTGIGLMTSGGSVQVPAPQAQIASNIVDPLAERLLSNPRFDTPAARYVVNPPTERLLSLQSSTPEPVLDAATLPNAQAGYESMGRQPRYIIDARPASYEPSSAFSF